MLRHIAVVVSSALVIGCGQVRHQGLDSGWPDGPASDGQPADVRPADVRPADARADRADQAAPDTTAADIPAPDLPPACTDQQQNGAETDVDCGGGTCPACADGKTCKAGMDCASGICQSVSSAKLTCAAASCIDGVQNGSETDVDCGGAKCAGCPGGKKCKAGTDCQSGACVGKACSNMITFSDDFSTDKGWTTTHPTGIYRDTTNNWVAWSINQQETRVMSFQLPTLFTDFVLEYDFRYDSHTNNCAIHVGAASSPDPGSDAFFTGVEAVHYWFGGGCSAQAHAIWTNSQDSTGAYTSSHAGYVCSGSIGTNIIPISSGTWYRVKLERSGGQAVVSASVLGGAPVSPLGSTAISLGSIPPLRYIVIGRGSVSDWPTCSGLIDNIKLEATP